MNMLACQLRMVVICAAMLVAASADGDTEGPSTVLPSGNALTLRHAVQMALRDSYAVRRARAQAAQVQAQAQQADRSVPSDPTIEMWTGRRHGLGNSLDASSSDTTTDVGIRISQELWLRGQGALIRGIAATQGERAQRQLEFLVATTAAQVRQAFLLALVAKRALATADQALDLARRVEATVERSLSAGGTTRMALNSAKLQRSRAEVAAAKAELDWVRARVALAQLIALSPQLDFDVTGNLIASELKIRDESELVDRAVTRRLDLAAAAADVVAARETLELSERELVPNLSVFAGYATEGKDDIATVGVSFALPLSRASRRGSVAAARAHLDETVASADELRASVEAEVVIAVAAYRQARREIEATGAGTLQLAVQNVEFARTALEAGKVGSNVVDVAQSALLDTRAAFVDALRSVALASIELERATGGIVAAADDGAAAQ